MERLLYQRCLATPINNLTHTHSHGGVAAQNTQSVDVCSSKSTHQFIATERIRGNHMTSSQLLQTRAKPQMSDAWLLVQLSSQQNQLEAFRGSEG